MKAAHFFLGVAGLLIGGLGPTPGPAADFYISATGASGDGSGRTAANAADASTPEKYRAINQTHTAPGTVIDYAPGTYLLSPAFSMADGVTHQGSGIDSTIIKVNPGSASGPFAPMWLADKGTISNFKFLDATIDFNPTNQPWWSQGKGGTMAFAFSTADHCTIQRVKFIHLAARGLEAFPIFFVVGTAAKGNLNHNLVDSCVFTEPIARGNTNGGLTCIMMADAEPAITVDDTNVVSHCQFTKLKAPEYSDLPYAQCCTCPMAVQNQASGVDCLWFIEPGTQTIGNNRYFAGQIVRVTGNTLIDSGAVCGILMHPNGDFAADLEVEDNHVGMTQHPYLLQGPRGPTGFAIEQYQLGNPSVGNITIQRNTFTAPLPTAVSPFAVSVNLTAGPGKFFHVKSLTVRDNTIVNFPQDGKELNVVTDPAYNPHYVEAGNKFDPSK